ncbi:acyltransferase [Aquimarina agarilytica]|uniref:acyltransferase n=1 Tax=Aquimarina agarilytica TaxID=1087449 RepID=UPI0002897B3A|nr:acyltransferase [Aquimarina agarilytica]
MKKFFWVIRGLVYKFYFGSFGFPSYIGKPLIIKKSRKIFIGKRVRIYPGVRLEVVSNNSAIVIRDNVSIGNNLHVVSNDDKLVINKDVTISANVFITNTEHNYQDISVHIMEQKLINKKTVIGENCFIGYGAVIQAGTILGKQCIVGANSVVRGDFPSYSVIVGAPARIVKRFNVETKKWQKTNSDGSFI